MNNIEILTKALEYIEENLLEDIKTQDVADACYCSKSALEKLFRNVSQISVREYIIKRRMTIAARMLAAADKGYTVLDIALACGYGSNEAFSRAFKGIWGMNPSEFEARKEIYELFPRISPQTHDGGAKMSIRKQVDISEMYDLFVQRKDCYFVCCDIKNLIPINEVSYKAGDMAILEALKRLEYEAGENDIVFRIGGDEFVMLTDSKEQAYADEICKCIASHNGEPIVYEGQEIPLSLYICTVKFDGNQIRYKDLYEQLHKNIMAQRK